MMQRNRADQDVRDGGAFAEGTEKTGVRDLEFCAQGDGPVLQGLKTVLGWRIQFAGPKDGGLAYTEWDSEVSNGNSG